MTSNKIHDTGEEYITKNGGDGDTFTVGLFNSEDKLSDSDDIGDITTEPNSSDYSRQTATFESVEHQSAFQDEWGLQNANDITIPVGDSDNLIDSYFIAKSFQSTDKGDSSAQLHLISTGFLNRQLNLKEGIENIIDVVIPAGFAGVRLGPDLEGTKFFSVGGEFWWDGGSNQIGEFTTDTPFNISSFETSTSFNDPLPNTSTNTLDFDVTGYKPVLSREDNGDIQQLILDEAYSLQSYVEITATVNSSSGARGLNWIYDGTKLIELGGSGVYEHTLSRPFDISTITSSTGISINDPGGYSEYNTASCWNDDGTKWFIAGSGHDIRSFTLSTPWDLSTASTENSFSSPHTVSLFGADPPAGIRFNPDGTILYIMDGGDTNDAEIQVFELSTPFDLTTRNGLYSSPDVDSETVDMTLDTLPKYTYKN